MSIGFSPSLETRRIKLAQMESSYREVVQELDKLRESCGSISPRGSRFCGRNSGGGDNLQARAATQGRATASMEPAAYGPRRRTWPRDFCSRL